MITAILHLDLIIKMANSFDFDNNEVFISKELLEIYNEIPQYSLPQVLEKLNISQLNLRKYLLQIEIGRAHV